MTDDTTSETVTDESAEQEILNAIGAAAKNISQASMPANSSEKILHLAEFLAWLGSRSQPH
uniref:hypothetical protein n=1 Tax=unclassified Rhodococcus (in: high G+C Gram-positive bacteria) TaxID=192944 RepID=UPI00113FD766|nr:MULTISPECIES: hypothetical protein [unclassified Rhodococcus (in: high G+C Gram-positive bacteria)]